MGFITADDFSDKAANLICQELGFQHAVDWVDFMDNSTRNYIVLSNLYCSNTVEELGDCVYNAKKIRYGQSPIIMLSCNPEPGEV